MANITEPIRRTSTRGVRMGCCLFHVIRVAQTACCPGAKRRRPAAQVRDAPPEHQRSDPAPGPVNGARAGDSTSISAIYTLKTGWLPADGSRKLHGYMAVMMIRKNWPKRRVTAHGSTIHAEKNQLVRQLISDSMPAKSW